MSAASKTLGTIPNEVRGEHPFLHPHKDHSNDFPRVEFIGNLAYWTSCSTNPAGEADLQFFPPGLTRYLILKLGI